MVSPQLIAYAVIFMNITVNRVRISSVTAMITFEIATVFLDLSMFWFSFSYEEDGYHHES